MGRDELVVATKTGRLKRKIVDGWAVLATDGMGRRGKKKEKSLEQVIWGLECLCLVSKVAEDIIRSHFGVDSKQVSECYAFEINSHVLFPLAICIFMFCYVIICSRIDPSDSGA